MGKIKIWLLMLLATLVAYGASARYGFSQDDFYFLAISRAHDLGQFLSFFSPFTQSGFAFFRPVGTQVYYFLFVSAFGLTHAPLAMHIFMLLLQSVNGYLVYLLVRKLVKNEAVAVTIGVLYAASAVHFLSLFYIAATQELLAACFSLLSLNFFLAKRYWRSMIFFGFALLSKETAVATPALAFLLTQYEFGFRIVNKKYLPRFLPYLLSSIFYLLVRLSAGLHVQPDYHMVFGTNVIGGLRWYWWFAFGLPERITSYAGSHLSVNFSQFTRDTGISGLFVALAALALSLFTLSRTVYELLRGGARRLRASIYILWWVAGIALVVAIPAHYYPHYLDLALIPLLLLMVGDTPPRIRYSLSGLYLVTSLVAINLSVATHWTVQRADMVVRAEKLITATHACDHSAWNITGIGSAPLEVSYALSLANGPRVLCNNPALQVEYGSAANRGVFTLPALGILQ